MDYEEIAADYQKAREDFFAKVSRGDIALDGVMSPLTRQLVEHFEADGVDMTLAWACTPREWECPSCGRAKSNIVRLNSKGQLMCRLVEHHDHMKDLVEREFKLACKSQNVLIADEQAKRFAARASQMVSAYDNAIICDDCNGADATAKGAAKTNKSFSYSPQEIRQFVRPQPNQPHEIDEKEARRIWQENAETFELRLKIIKRIATIAATNTHWYQELPLFQRAEAVYNRAEFLASSCRARSALYELAGDKSRPLPEDPAQWRRVVQPRPSTLPSIKDIEYVAKVTSTKSWNSVPDDWHCMTCKRPKRETIRRSKKDWTFLLSDRGYYDPAAQYKTERALICAECGALATNLGREASHTAGIKSDQNYARYLKLSELEHVVRPQAYGRHNVDNELADSLMERLVTRVRALNDATAE
jgi:rubredoxin